MKAGFLRHRLTFQKKTQSRNSFNEMEESYSDHCTVWGSVSPNAGKKYYDALQAEAEVSGEIRIRYRADILPTMRISYAGRYLSIVSIANIQEKNREILIYYKEALD